MVQSAGFEPATVRLEGGCSIQLSYDCIIDLVCEPVPGGNLRESALAVKS